MKCIWHSCQKSLKERQRKFCSKKCKSKYHVDKHRKNLKVLAVKFKGGKCILCGYNKCVWALVFHHLQSNSKLFSIGSGNTKSWKCIKQELKKCILVCQNCHHEIHAGLISPILNSFSN